MKYIVYQSQSVGMSCLQNPLFVIVRRERDISTAILVAKFTCIERLEEITLTFSKYHVVADNPIWRQSTVRNVRARQERESTKVKLFKSIRESMRELEGQTTARV